MQAVKPFCFVGVEHRGDDGIDAGFDDSIAEAEDDAAPVKQLITVFLSSHERVATQAVNGTVSCKSQSNVDKITGEGKNHRHLVADAVNEKTEHDDAHTERPDARALQFTDRNLVQPKIRDELSAAQNHAADKRVARGDEGNETATENNFVVTVVHDGFGDCHALVVMVIDRNFSPAFDYCHKFGLQKAKSPNDFRNLSPDIAHKNTSSPWGVHPTAVFHAYARASSRACTLSTK